jgi:hypothetical protein
MAARKKVSAPAPVASEPAPVVAAAVVAPVVVEEEGAVWCYCGCGLAVDRDRGERHRFYASPLCAYRGMLKRRGEETTSPLLRARAQAVVERAEARATRPKPVPPPRREKTPEELEHSDLRYGPKRTVTKVLEVYGPNNGRAKVEMECGHVRAWYAGETVARCMKCRPTHISGGSAARVVRPQQSEVAF